MFGFHQISEVLQSVYDRIGFNLTVAITKAEFVEGLSIEADFSLPAVRVIRTLDQIIEWRGKPKRLRCDNGPEFISQDLEKWTDKHNIQLEFIQPGKPQQNAYVERYNRTVRYSWLSQYLFESIKEVQDYATGWLWFYNHERPNKANGGLPPKHMLSAA